MADNFRDLFPFWIHAIKEWSVRSRHQVDSVQSVTYCLPNGDIVPGSGLTGAWENLQAEELDIEMAVGPDLPGNYLIVDLDGETLVRWNNQAVFGVNAFHRRVPFPQPLETPAMVRLEVGRFGLMGQRFDRPAIRELAWYQIDPWVEDIAYDLEVLVDYSRSAFVSDHLRSWWYETLKDAISPIYSMAPDEYAWTRWVHRVDVSAEEEGLARYLAEQAVPGLTPVPRAKWEPRLREVGERLQQIFRHVGRGGLTPSRRLVAEGHAHIDFAWLWPVAETARKVVRTLATQASLLDHNEDFTFGWSSPAQWQMVEENEPALFLRLKQHVTSGRLEPLGAFWVESDGQLPDAVAILRHLVYTFQYYRDHLGFRPETAFLPDTFGFSEGLPTLFAQAGIRLFCTTKLTWNDTTRFPYRDFWWVGPDGRRVQAHIFGGPESGYNGSASIQDVAGQYSIPGAAKNPDTILYLYGHGDGGGGSEQGMIERLRRYPKLPGMPEIAFGHVRDLIVAESEPLPEYRGELYLQYHRGVFTAQSHMKSIMREIQDVLWVAEMVSLWAGLNDDFRDRWTRVLKNQFHDILPGSSIAAVYRDSLSDLSAVREEIVAAMASAADHILGAEPRVTTTLTVLNRSGFRAPPQLAEITLPFWPEIAVDGQWHVGQMVGPDRYLLPLPAMDAVSFYQWPLRPSEALGTAPESTPSMIVKQTVVTTGRLTVVLEAEGISALHYDGELLLKGRAGVRAYWQHPDKFDAWELMPDYDEHPVAMQHEDVLVEEAGPYGQCIQLRHHVADSEVTERYFIDTLHHRLDVTITSVIRNRHLLVRYAVPTRLVSQYVTAEGLWGTTQRPTVPQGLESAARWEWVAHRFVDLSEGDLGIALMNNGRYGHGVKHGELSLTLSTAPLYPDPTADQEPSVVTLRLLPHHGGYKEANIMAEAHAFNAGVWSKWGNGHGDRREQLISGLPENLRVLGMKGAADGSGDMILYLGEMLGRRGRVTLQWHRTLHDVQRVDLVTEIPLASGSEVEVLEGGTIHTPYTPYDLLVLRLRTESS